MMKKTFVSLSVVLALGVGLALARADDEKEEKKAEKSEKKNEHKKEKEILLPGGGGFDYVKADAASRKLYVAHSTTARGGKTCAVDTKTHKLYVAAGPRRNEKGDAKVLVFAPDVPAPEKLR